MCCKAIFNSARYKGVMGKVNIHKEYALSCRQNKINEFLYEIKNRKPHHIKVIDIL